MIRIYQYFRSFNEICEFSLFCFFVGKKMCHWNQSLSKLSKNVLEMPQNIFDMNHEPSKIIHKSSRFFVIN